jgi:hypothetical protein
MAAAHKSDNGDPPAVTRATAVPPAVTRATGDPPAVTRATGDPPAVTSATAVAPLEGTDAAELVAQIRHLAGADPAGVQRVVADVLSALDRAAGGALRDQLPEGLSLGTGPGRPPGRPDRAPDRPGRAPDDPGSVPDGSTSAS